MMILNRKNWRSLETTAGAIPADAIFSLPEKILQFGTGVLLRALPDYFVDRANRQGIFNGRIVLVKSTQTDGADAFHHQDGLYTLRIRGMESGEPVEQRIICSAISRVLSAADQWEAVLRTASSKDMQVVISNTTEVGIRLVNESIFQKPPESFPGKLLSFLYERYKAFDGDPVSGMIVIPTELITDNGKKLKSILTDLAEWNGLEKGFMRWLDKHNQFCNSLVDRIVPGKPDSVVKNQLESEWGYQDDLMSDCEVYRLWAIEGDAFVRQILSFSAADEGVVITPDITRFKELKLRMLNATHTLSCGPAFLSGFKTVVDAMNDPRFSSYVEHLMLSEIGRAIPFAIPEKDIQEFGRKVLDRFRNPYLRHMWLSITMQYSSKMASRVIPVLIRFYELFKHAPEKITEAFAGFIYFMRPVKKEGSQFYGVSQGEYYLINDDRAEYFFNLWLETDLRVMIRALLSNTSLWAYDLETLPLFGEKVFEILVIYVESGFPRNRSEI